MRICRRAIDFVQIINAEGDVRICGWNRDNIIGNLLKEDFRDILHGCCASSIRENMAQGDYSNCDVDNCPYLANGMMEEILIDMEEIPDYPTELHLAYEGVCNYNCTCCTSHQHMADTRKYDYSNYYELIEKRLEKILPNVRTIGANGRGELFVSKRILKLLASWKPIAPPEEVNVILETNGSLFDEMHWRQIENLGQYQLSVFISIMSFDEKIYQHLSGTKLPIARLEDNLRFVKGLREKGIINYLELATVLQEENFREMPEFTRRCIEEFGADKVRIRPIMPGGIYDKNIAWFMDVRNPKHPYYAQYTEIMSHPIFQNPKVLLWSGNMESLLGEHPGIKAQKVEQVRDCAEWILDKPEFIDDVVEWVLKKGYSKVYLYGIGLLGKLLIRLSEGKIPIAEIYDKYSKLKSYEGIQVKKPEKAINDSDGIMLVTTYGEYEKIKGELIEFGFWGEIVSLYNLMREGKLD